MVAAVAEAVLAAAAGRADRTNEGGVRRGMYIGDYCNYGLNKEALIFLYVMLVLLDFFLSWGMVNGGLEERAR